MEIACVNPSRGTKKQTKEQKKLARLGIILGGNFFKNFFCVFFSSHPINLLPSNSN
jgi:hypothetical protein